MHGVGAASCASPCCARRFCGNVAPPTFNTVSNRLRVTFVSDSSVGAQGFSARYRAVTPAESESPMPGHCQGPSGLGTASRDGRVPGGTPRQPGCLWLRAESCAWDEHLCDQGLCLQLGFVCDGFHDCKDRSDEANCSLKHKGGWDRPLPAAPSPSRTWGVGRWRAGRGAGVNLVCLCVPAECGGPLTTLEGQLSTPNHPQPYPHQQVREGDLWEQGEDG